ncbi:MAG: hypothetical protein QOJ03_800 [Frankiaceae bacterium]|nr:hypothetical protein [Frankiaceae bacterium]
MDLGLRGRVYVVTGGTKGLGFAAAQALVDDGALVVVSSRSRESVDAAVATLGAGSAGVVADNADAGTPDRLVTQALSSFGRIDGALVSVGGPPGTSALGATDEQWRAAFESVFLGAVRTVRAIVPHLGEGGVVGLVLSTSVKQPINGIEISNGLRPGLAMWAKQLADELGRQILPDGGHISRNPGALIELLVDLLPLRQLFTARNLAPPAALLNAIDRMMPMLRFFRHGDGSFALFNGMGPTPTDLLTTILAYDDARGMPVANAPHSGYQRVDANGTVVLMDTGVPPPMAVSTEAHAGCLAFELSTRQNRIVVNCGLPATSRDSWRQVARSTPAHSTATFNDASSCRFVESGAIKRMLDGVPIVSGPRRVTAQRGEQDGAIVLRTSHDGYTTSFDVIHQRSLMLAADGRRLDGEDVFSLAIGEAFAAGRDQFAIRFHLHPSVKANRLSDTHGAMLVMSNKEVWTFTAYEDRIDLEESVYLAGKDGPRRAVQLVIHGRARNVTRVQWTFAMSTTPNAAPRRGRGEEPQLPL